MTNTWGTGRRTAVLAALVVAGACVGLLASWLLGHSAAADWVAAGAFSVVTVGISLLFRTAPRMKVLIWPTLALGGVVVAARVVSALGGEPGWGFLGLTLALFIIWVSLVLWKTRGLLEREPRADRVAGPD